MFILLNSGKNTFISMLVVVSIGSCVYKYAPILCLGYSIYILYNTYIEYVKVKESEKVFKGLLGAFKAEEADIGDMSGFTGK